MKTNISKTLGVLAAAILLASLAPHAIAGPDPQMFRPVTTMKKAESLKVGTTLAISCGNCGGVSTITVDQGRSYLRGFTCPMCKREFHVLQPGGGARAAAQGQFVYVDKAEHFAHLAAATLK